MPTLLPEMCNSEATIKNNRAISRAQAKWNYLLPNSLNELILAVAQIHTIIILYYCLKQFLFLYS